MNRRQNGFGHDPERARLEQAMNAARAIPLGGQKAIEPKLNWTPTSMGQMATLPVPLPDQNGNPIVFCFGGPLLHEDFAITLLAGSNILDGNISEAEYDGLIRRALGVAQTLIMISRQPQPNPPAPETIVE